MNDTHRALLEIIKNSISSDSYDDHQIVKSDVKHFVRSDYKISEKSIKPLLQLADEQNILSLIYDGISTSSPFRSINKQLLTDYRDRSLFAAIRQITQTNEFLNLVLNAQEQELDPVVLKGIICRSLYPIACLRPSVDEDILILPEETDNYHRFLSEEGLIEDRLNPNFLQKPASSLNMEAVQQYLEGSSELSYHKPDSPTYIELHKSLFDPESDVFDDFNELFTGAFERTMHVQIEDVSVRTLAPVDHLLYLILHAFKHFVHSGIGIRAVCDIGLFAEHYGDEISKAEYTTNVSGIDHSDGTDSAGNSISGWEHIRTCLEKVHAFDFARGLLHIVKEYLLPDAGFFAFISDDSTGNDWHIDEIDIEPLLEDILASGVHGNSSIERLHSSNITLRAVTQERKAGSTTESAAKSVAGSTGLISSAFHSIFLPLKSMVSRYPYLKKAPILLPFAWTQRIGRYIKERISSSDKKSAADRQRNPEYRQRSATAESLRLGKSRVELLRKYGIIPNARD